MIASSPALIAEIPLIDWKGPDFLLFYAVAYLIATAWTWQRIRARNARYDIPAPPQELSDPYEIALLAGGKPRVMEVLLLKMLKSGVIAWDSQWSTPRLVTTEAPLPSGLNLLERTLIDRIRGTGTGGWHVAAIDSALNPEFEQLEAKLAAKGLRPTAKEWRKNHGEGTPLIALAVLGGIKILVGLDRGRPVSFLFIAVAITVLTKSLMMKHASNRRGGLTAAGQAALEKVRIRNQWTTTSTLEESSPNLALWAIGPALFGAAAVAAATEFPEVSTWMMRNPRLGQPAPAGGDGGSSSGCSTSTYSSCSSSDSGGGSSCSSSSDSGGGSSCGSSGCGGCGGGGGD
ncbi:MAG: hypothetical protein JWO82_4137 [Akkermansiaceae bacterium]|nr:hypothetical protein [Akkermansiaceae bacterium]